MKLQILVPQYTETDEVVKPLLDSIQIQQSVDLANDVGVIIVNDGSDVCLSDKLLNSYTFKIEYYRNEHKGVSATRNELLRRATAEYVMYCDADDLFFNACGLWIVFREIKKGFDSLVSVFTEEVYNKETGDITYINHEHDSTFVHGKVHRRQYLIDKGIWWNEDLTIHEDSYFNTLCQALSEDVIYIGSPFYLWKYRESSVCRHDPKYMLKTYGNLIDSNEALVDELQRRELTDKADMLVIHMVFGSYYTMNKPQWVNQENSEYRDSVEARFGKYFRKYKSVWERIPDEEKMKMSMGIRNRAVMNGMQMERITIEDWLQGRE